MGRGWNCNAVGMHHNTAMERNDVIEPAAVVRSVHHLVPLAGTVAVLSLLSHLLAGDLAIPVIGDVRLAVIASFTVLCGIFYPIVYVVPPIVDRIIQGKATEEMPPPWRRNGWSPVAGAIVMVLTLYGITASGNLTELYRAGATPWYDEVLWQLEYPLFLALRDSWLDQPWFWDRVYFLLWPFVLMAAVYTHSADGIRRYAVFGIATVLSFYLTRCVNLALPTAGPAFFQPDWFNLAGTSTQTAQDAIREFTVGRLPGNGVCPATMAMPSLHVGLTGIAAWFLADKRPWTLCFSVPWLLLIWISTVVLGWHYVLDGPVGLGVAGISILLANIVQNVWDRCVYQRRKPAAAGISLEGISTRKMPETAN